MDPNSTDKTNTPPAEVPTPEVPANPETPETPTPTPVEAAPTPEAPAATPEPTAPVATEAPASLEAAPVTPTPPAEATPFTAGAPEPPKKANTKKIILIAGIAAGAVLLAIIGAILFFVFTTVSKEDYRAAASQFNEVSRSNSKLNSEVSTLSYSTDSATDSEFDETLTAAKDAIANVKTENEELSKLKAVRVGEGGKLYKAFEEKLNPYLAYAGDLVASVEKVRPAMVVCDAVSGTSDAAARVTALKKCSEALGAVGQLPNAEFNTFIGGLKDSYAEYATTYEGISKLSDPYGDNYEQYKTLRDKMYAVQDKIGDASDTFSDGLEARDNEYDVKPSAEALADYLTEQQR